MCIENSHNRCGGCALSLEYMQSLKDWAAELVRSHPLSHAHPYIGVIPSPDCILACSGSYLHTCTSVLVADA